MKRLAASHLSILVVAAAMAPPDPASQQWAVERVDLDGRIAAIDAILELQKAQKEALEPLQDRALEREFDGAKRRSPRHDQLSAKYGSAGLVSGSAAQQPDPNIMADALREYREEADGNEQDPMLRMTPNFPAVADLQRKKAQAAEARFGPASEEALRLWTRAHLVAQATWQRDTAESISSHLLQALPAAGPNGKAALKRFLSQVCGQGSVVMMLDANCKKLPELLDPASEQDAAIAFQTQARAAFMGSNDWQEQMSNAMRLLDRAWPAEPGKRALARSQLAALMNERMHPEGLAAARRARAEFVALEGERSPAVEYLDSVVAEREQRDAIMRRQEREIQAAGAKIGEWQKQLEPLTARAGVAAVALWRSADGDSGPNSLWAGIDNFTFDLMVETGLRNADTGERFDALYDQTPALLYAIERSCNGDRCIAGRYSELARFKGLFTSLFSRSTDATPMVATAASPEERLDSEQMRKALEEWGMKLKAKPGSADDIPEGLAEAIARQYGVGGQQNSSGAAAGQKAAARHVSQFLKPDEALVDLYRAPILGAGGKPVRDAEGHIRLTVVAFVVTRSGTPILVRVTSGADPERLWLDWMEQARQTSTKADHAWEQLRHHVWQPIQAALPAGVKRVYLSPDGDLGMMPWQIFPEPGLQLTMVYGGQEIIRLARKPATATRRFLLVDGIDYGPGTAFPALAPNDGVFRAATRGGLSVRRLQGTQATASALAQAMPGAEIVHLDTHSVYAAPAQDKPALDRSYVALAGANGGAGGQWKASGMIGLHLSGVSLVTLASCQSGRGEAMSGQGLVGMVGVLAGAGARSLLLSLWKVADAPTRLLMDEFYGALLSPARPPKAEALRKAQAAVRAQYPNQRDWAGWVLVGEGW